MECKSGCHERKNLHQFNGHLQHWTEAETKSDSQVESLINVAEVKANLTIGMWTEMWSIKYMALVAS